MLFWKLILRLLCNGWNFVSNLDSDEDGRVIIIWKPPLSVRVLAQSRQSLSVEVTLPTGPRFVYTAIYASNLHEERCSLWVELINLQTQLLLDSLPWIMGGDFNQIINPSEHSSTSVNSLTPPMLEFSDTLLQLGLFDLRFLGPLHTWSNNQPSEPISKKLDRVLVNQHWITSYPDSTAQFLAPDLSDHSPSLIDLAVPLPVAGTRPFKFFNYLTKHPKFLTVVVDSWTRAGNAVDNLRDLFWKLKTIKRELKTLNRENFSKIQERVILANHLLNVVQVQALTDPSPELFRQQRDLRLKWEFLRTIEEAYFRQKSRINWLKEGDLNTSYFHRIWKVRTAVNSIRFFILSNGDCISDPVAMGMIALSHFKSILAPDHLQPTISTPQWFTSLLSFSCSAPQKLIMSTKPLAEEISSTFFKLNPNKSPGPDGLSPGFFKASWNIIGPEVIDSILRFFQTSFLPSTVNATILTLVPKHSGASSISDYRPISCCSTIYKAISKMLVARLKPILPKLIFPNQTAFVKGRLLIENTILATELVRGYHSDKGPPRITLKVDIAKAFDTLNWIFSSSASPPSKFLKTTFACFEPAYAQQISQ